MVWTTRASAGHALAALLRRQHIHEQPALIVLGLARGGMIVAAEVARDLRAPLDVLVVRKLGLPFQPEVAMGALAPGVELLDHAMIAEFGVSAAALQDVVRRETTELQRRSALYRGDRSTLNLLERTVLLVDDGLATGMTALAAARSVLTQRPANVIVAAPIGSRDACRRLHESEPRARCICVHEVDLFGGVGAYYRDFPQVSDAEVIASLR